LSSATQSFFHYHAYAYGFGAQFTRPFQENIDVQAATALPVTGGHGTSRVENFKFHEFIRFGAAFTHVSGGKQEEDKSNNTLVTSVIENLNLMEALTIGRTVCRLYSKHPHDAPEGRVTMQGSRFENVYIGSHEIKIELNLAMFDKIQTFEQAKAALAQGGEFKAAVLQAEKTSEAIKNAECHSSIALSLVKKDGIKVPEGCGVEVDGHSIYIPGFGRVFFAEVFISHGTRTLTMLRFELGSSTKGGGSGGSGTTNGKNFPPTG